MSSRCSHSSWPALGRGLVSDTLHRPATQGASPQSGRSCQHSPGGVLQEVYNMHVLNRSCIHYKFTRNIKWTCNYTCEDIERTVAVGFSERHTLTKMHAHTHAFRPTPSPTHQTLHTEHYTHMCKHKHKHTHISLIKWRMTQWNVWSYTCHFHTTAMRSAKYEK